MQAFRALSAIIFAVAVAAPSLAQTAEERARLDWVGQRGRMLYDLDRAAWVGTDDMLERIRDARSIGLRGYIVERDGEALSVIFFGGADAAPVAFYRGRVVDGRVVDRDVFPAGARPALTPAQRRLAAVRAMAPLMDRRSCNEGALNTAVIPPESPDGPIDLYLLTPQVRTGEFSFGGHSRFTIAADGSVVSSRDFARSCLVFGGERSPRPERTEAMMVTHLLDPIPTEIHVFTSLSARLPVFVGTADQRVWAVEGDRIRLIQPEPDR